MIPDDVRQLVRLAQKRARSLEELCDVLKLNPKRAKALVVKAKRLGSHVEIVGGVVGWREPAPPARVRDLGIPPVVGKRQTVGVISDLHLGSLYCLRAQLREHVNVAYDRGAREILCPGDVLDGCYRHGRWELSHHGIDAQTEDLYETLPRRRGLTYHCITGNHDETFTNEIGVDVGRYIESTFRARGRDDVRFHGNRGAFLRVRGAVVHLWHPRSGGAYARSYGIQKQVERYSPGQKPQVLLAGHWHSYCHIQERGVECIACPTFQGAGSAFSRSLGGAPSIGGLILSWDRTEHGTLRGFVLEARRYFEVERPIDVGRAA